MADSKRARVESQESAELSAAAALQDEALSAAEAVQHDLEELNEEASAKVLAVERAYNEKRRPVYARRAEAIRKISGFYLRVFLNHPVLSSLIDSADQDLLKHLVEIDVEDQVETGFTIKMYFTPNEYIENEVLTKQFDFLGSGEVQVTPSPIKWKPGKDLTTVESDVSGADGEGKREREESSSFFLWFNEEDQDTHLGELLKDEIFMNPFAYFNPTSEEDEEDEEEYGEEEGGEEEEEGGDA